MILYHGSNMGVRRPRLIFVPNRALDFGTGFYAASSEAQAVSWSKAKTRRRGCGTPTVSVYECREAALSELSVLRFASADAEWLRFVAANRRGGCRGARYDLVTGPVANDNTMFVINAFMKGVMDERAALAALKSQRLSDQYAFRTRKAISALKWLEERNP